MTAVFIHRKLLELIIPRFKTMLVLKTKPAYSKVQNHTSFNAETMLFQSSKTECPGELFTLLDWLSEFYSAVRIFTTDSEASSK